MPDENDNKTNPPPNPDGNPPPETPPPTVAERLAMTPEDLAKQPEALRSFSHEEMTAHQTTVADKATEDALTAEATRLAEETQLKAATAERTRLLGNHAAVEKLLRSGDEADQKAAQAIMRGDVPVDAEGKPLYTPEETTQLKQDWLSGHSVAAGEERATITSEATTKFLSSGIQSVRGALPDVGIPDIGDPAWAGIAKEWTSKGGLFAYFVNVGKASRDAEIEAARTEGATDGRRAALAATPGRRETPPATVVVDAGKSLMDTPSRDLIMAGNKPAPD